MDVSGLYATGQENLDTCMYCMSTYLVVLRRDTAVVDRTIFTKGIIPNACNGPAFEKAIIGCALIVQLFIHIILLITAEV